MLSKNAMTLSLIRLYYETFYNTLVINFLDVKPLKQLDLTNLDHVIKIDTDHFSEDGCLHNTKINTILVKDQPMKDQ